LKNISSSYDYKFTNNIRESRDRYDAGMETLSNLLEAQAMWQQAKSESVEAGCNAQLAATRYYKAAGKLK
jgi:outer membrane protein TolC